MTDSSATTQPTKETTHHGGGTIGKLALALSKAQGVIKNAAKDNENPAFKRGEKVSTYADLASVWDACREALSANEIAVIQQVSGGPETVTVSTVLAHSSGEQISCSMTGKPTKPDVQGLGSTVTYLRRYSLAAMVGVAPEDDDGNAASGKDVQTQAKVKEIDRAKASSSETAKTNGLWLNDGGAGSTHGSVSAYLDALEGLLSKADDPAQMFDLNESLLGQQQAKAFKVANDEKATEAGRKMAQGIVARITAIHDNIHKGTIPGKQAAE